MSFTVDIGLAVAISARLMQAGMAGIIFRSPHASLPSPAVLQARHMRSHQHRRATVEFARLMMDELKERSVSCTCLSKGIPFRMLSRHRCRASRGSSVLPHSSVFCALDEGRLLIRTEAVRNELRRIKVRLVASRQQASGKKMGNILQNTSRQGGLHMKSASVDL